MGGKSKSVYLSDHWAIEDGLNFKVFKPALMDIIHNADTPLTVGVFGTWGSGKTSLLHMLEGDLLAAGLRKKYCPVWFTAWKYDKQEALWRAFILRVIDELYPKENGERIPVDDLTDENQQEGVRYLDRLTKSVYQNVSWEGEASWSVDWQKTGKEMVKLPFWLALHLVGQKDAAKDLGLTPQLAELIEREAATHYMNQLTSMEQFEDKFEQAIKKILGPEGRLVVFVDDLDRCLPEKAIEILEAIKLFLHVPQTVFVLGMDREIVRRGIESHYGTYLHDDGKERPDLPINGDSYLQKIIQLPFNLPTLDASGRESFIGELQKHLERQQKLDKTTCQVFARGLLPNPRQVKRALNVFNLLRSIAEEQENRGLIKKEDLSWPLLAKTVLIQSQWPELYALWRQYSTLIQRLEEEYGKQPFTEQEMLTGQAAPMRKQVQKAGEGEASDEEKRGEPQKQGGILGEYLNNRSKYVLLAELLTFPKEGFDEAGQRTRFLGLNQAQMKVYFTLAGTADTVDDELLAGLPTDLNEMLLSGDAAIIQDALSRIDGQEKETDGPLHKGAVNTLVIAASSDPQAPPKRAACADAADQLGYMPDDLYDFVPIPDANHPQFFIGKYPVTNAQFSRFLKPENFAFQDFWCDFPKYDENSGLMQGETFGDEGWDWRQKAKANSEYTVKNGVLLPRFWHDRQFGGLRSCAPVVGVSWYEANAYCKWVLTYWEELEERKSLKKPKSVRLPTEGEWVQAAGGEEGERYPWGQLKDPQKEIMRHANTEESGIGRTTPVWMYPQGASQPHGVMDLSGNVWEWQANFWDEQHNGLALRGGSWDGYFRVARVAYRNYDGSPLYGGNYFGFRLAVFALPH
jgi:formylglycine-generating enzyme required for sulfatase activity